MAGSAESLREGGKEKRWLGLEERVRVVVVVARWGRKHGSHECFG